MRQKLIAHTDLYSCSATGLNRCGFWAMSFCLLLSILFFPTLAGAFDFNLNCQYGSPIDLGSGDFEYASSSCEVDFTNFEILMFYISKTLIIILAFLLLFLIILVFLNFKR